MFLLLLLLRCFWNTTAKPAEKMISQRTLMPAILSSPLNLFCRVVPAAPVSGDSMPHLGTAPAFLRAFMASRISEEYSSF
jgi:hypothetical protein